MGKSIKEIIAKNTLKLAKDLHEAGREAVEKRQVLVKDPKFQRFIEWDELPPHAQKGRITQAKYLMNKYNFIEKKTLRKFD